MLEKFTLTDARYLYIFITSNFLLKCEFVAFKKKRKIAHTTPSYFPEPEKLEKMLKHSGKVKLTFNWMMLELLLTRKLQTYRINSFAVLDNAVSAFYANFAAIFVYSTISR